MTHRAGFPRIPARSAQRGAPPTRLTARVMAPRWLAHGPPARWPAHGPRPMARLTVHRIAYGIFMVRCQRSFVLAASQRGLARKIRPWPGGSSRGGWMFAVVIRVSITSNKGKQPRFVIPESSGSECGFGRLTTQGGNS